MPKSQPVRAPPPTAINAGLAEESSRSRGDDTRARLFTSAIRLFADRGYEGTTVDLIVREAGVAKGTFFIHFATKDAVITQLVRNQVNVARRAREGVLASRRSPVDALRAAVMTLAEQAASDRQLTRAVITANILNPTLGGFAESVFGGIIAEMMADARAAQRAGLLDPKVGAEQIAGTLITSYFGAALYFATAPRSKPLLRLLAPVVESNLAGFRPPSGRRPSRASGAEKATRTRKP
jgi:AcrR family transcriptional regulator